MTLPAQSSFFLAPLVAASGTALLVAEEEIQELDPTIVTAGRIEESLMETPYTVEVTTEAFILENSRRTLPESLQFTPGVLVQKTAYGHGSPYIRGFTGRQNLLLVDDVRMNNALYRGGPVQYWNTVDPYSLERIELIKSQGSVLYGSDAIGGTLNAFTKSSNFQFEDEGRFFNHGMGYYEYRSNGEGSHIGRLETAFGVGGEFGVLLGVTGKEFGDIRDSAVGLMQNTGYPEQDLDLRFDMALNPNTTLTVLHQNVNQDEIWRWHSTIYNPGWQHDGHVAAAGTYKSRIYDQERSLTYIKVAGEDPEEAAWISRWSATLSYQTGRDSEAQDRSAAAVDRRYQITEIDTLGFDLSFESPLADGTLVYGLDYYRDLVDSSGYRDRGAGLAYDPSFRPVADDSTYDLFGAYAQYVWRPVERLEITAGGRYTYAAAELGRYYDGAAKADLYGATRHWNDFTGSLRALYRINDCWNLYGGVSQAFRAPDLNDLSGNLTTRSGTPSLGSVDVDPEEFVTWELGGRYMTATRYFNISAFYTDISDTITSVPTAAGAGTSVTTNGQDGYVYGIELEGTWEFRPGWVFSGYAAWQDGRTETPAFFGGPVIEESASRLLPLSGSVALRWTHPSDRLWIEGRVLAVAKQDRLSASDRRDTQRIPTGGTPGYVVAMLHAGWQATDNLELTCGLENLTDEDYRSHGSGQNEPGFNAIVGAKLSW
ncbi:TonB-dependent receptor plug domain-containing protein [Haloferula sp.]|uniref:TonB-dependent receptor plug domain-containing protein n=1 Tax=Haloferula sp. TaxID=2497595 RepID=UPI003C77B064